MDNKQKGFFFLHFPYWNDILTVKTNRVDYMVVFISN